jgi:hypothetical protein
MQLDFSGVNAENNNLMSVDGFGWNSTNGNLNDINRDFSFTNYLNLNTMDVPAAAYGSFNPVLNTPRMLLPDTSMTLENTIDASNSPPSFNPVLNTPRMFLPDASTTLENTIDASDASTTLENIIDASKSPPSAKQSNEGIAILPSGASADKENNGHESSASDRASSSRVRRPPLSKEVPTTSIWREAAYTYFCQELDSEEWKQCIDMWLEFEKNVESGLDTNSVSIYPSLQHPKSLNLLKYRLPAKERPVLLTKWVGTRRYGNIPKIPDMQVFADEWVKWWNSLQPKWRRNASSDGLPMALSDGKPKDDLSALRKGGPSGIVTILIGLKWWASIRETDKRWKLAVDDIYACFKAFSAGKRKGGPLTDNKGRGKKQKMT